MDNSGNHAKREAYGYVSAMRDQTSKRYEDKKRKDGRIDLSGISTRRHQPRAERMPLRSANAKMWGRFGEMDANLTGWYENRKSSERICM